MTINVPTFRTAMAQFPGAVTLIATGTGEERRGITATAVCSVTDSPPSLLICVNRKAATREAIARNRRFSVTLLDAGSADIAQHFAGMTGASGADKFTKGDWDLFACGVPLLRSAPVSLACLVSEMFEVGSHTIFVGQIAESHFGEGPAMVYADKAFHQLVRLPGA
jgi:flavin reductase (NADH)